MKSANEDADMNDSELGRIVNSLIDAELAASVNSSLSL